MSRDANPGQGRRDLRKYRQGAGKIPKTHRAPADGDKKPKGCPLTTLMLLALPAAGVWALIEWLVG